MLELIHSVGGLVDASFATAVSLALLGFFWGLAKFVFRIEGNEKAVEEGKRVMKWGLLALFVIVSVWGIVRYFQNSLNLFGGTGGTGGPPDPFLPPIGGGFE